MPRALSRNQPVIVPIANIAAASKSRPMSTRRSSSSRSQAGGASERVSTLHFAASNGVSVKETKSEKSVAVTTTAPYSRK